MKAFVKQWVVFLPLLVLIVLLFDNHIIKPDQAGNLLTGESTYGDLPFHMGQMAQMAYGHIFPPENPLYAHTLLVYPYFINLISVLLVWLGMGSRNSILLPGIFFSALMIVTLYLFNHKVTKSRPASILAVYLFFLNGGLGFYYFAKDVILTGQLADFLSQPTSFKEYSHLFVENIQWCSFLTRILVPERSVLLGITMGLVIVYLLFLQIPKRKHSLDWSLLVAAVLAGLLPLSHTHTFIVFAFLIPFLAIFELKKDGLANWLLRWFVFGGLVFAIAFPQLKLIFMHLGESSTFIRFHLGWMSKPGFMQFLLFWWKNSGLLIPLTILSLFFGQLPAFLKKLVTFSFFIFIIINLFLFQPFDWDNVKFLFWFAVFADLAVAVLLEKVWRMGGVVRRLLVGTAVFTLIFSSMVSFYREVQIKNWLFSAEDVQLGYWVKNSTPKDALFLTSFTHNSFVSNLGGRRILMGYQGSLWVHGIKYGTREKDIREIYLGGHKAKNLINQYGIDYIVVGPGERNNLNADENYFQQNFYLIKKTGNYQIFAVSQQSKP